MKNPNDPSDKFGESYERFRKEVGSQDPGPGKRTPRLEDLLSGYGGHKPYPNDPAANEVSEMLRQFWSELKKMQHRFELMEERFSVLERTIRSNPTLLTTDEAAQFLRISKRQLYYMCQNKTIKFRQMGRKFLFEAEELLRVTKLRGKEGESP